MFAVSPLYVQRQYARNDGHYKISAVSKLTTAPKIAGQQPQPGEPVQQFKPPDAGYVESAGEPPQETNARTDGRAPREPRTGAGFTPDSHGRTRNDQPYHPVERFRDTGFYSGYPLPQRMPPEQQMPLAKRYESMLSAYRSN